MIVMSKPVIVPSVEYDENTLLLLHGGSFLDASMYGREITNHGVEVSEEQSVFGGESLFFDGSSYLGVQIPIDGDVTVDFWMYVTEYKQWTVQFYFTAGETKSPCIYCQITGSSSYIVDKDINTGDSTYVTTGSLSVNEWHHVAVVRSGTTLYAFFDGVLVGTKYNVASQPDNLVIGSSGDGVETTAFVGYMDEFRVSDVGRWTKNFTPPTEAYRG